MTSDHGETMNSIYMKTVTSDYGETTERLTFDFGGTMTNDSGETMTSD